MIRPYLAATGFVLMGAILLSGCDAPPAGGQAEADAQTRAACRQRAEQAYEQQNRAEIYSPSSSVNTPYSANYVPDSPERGLSDLFAHDRMVSDCVRNTGTGADRSVPDTAVPPPGH
jgi:PBP1b-binding outer membrane lipoprotein LpoB